MTADEIDLQWLAALNHLRSADDAPSGTDCTELISATAGRTVSCVPSCSLCVYGGAGNEMHMDLKPKTAMLRNGKTAWKAANGVSD